MKIKILLKWTFMLLFLASISMIYSGTMTGNKVMAKSKKKTIILNPITLEIGVTTSINIEGVDLKDAKWSSNKKKIVFIKDGKVLVKKAGKAVLRVKVKNTIYKVKIIVPNTIIKVELREEEKKIQEKIKALEEEFPDGMKWDNEDSYFCDMNNTMGYGCAGFSFKITDMVFDKTAPMKKDKDFTDIDAKLRVGDIIRVNEGEFEHSVVVLDRYQDGIFVVEGNFEGKIKWGERYTYKELREKGIYFITRYPE